MAFARCNSKRAQRLWRDEELRAGRFEIAERPCVRALRREQCGPCDAQVPSSSRFGNVTQRGARLLRCRWMTGRSRRSTKSRSKQRVGACAAPCDTKFAAQCETSSYVTARNADGGAVTCQRVRPSNDRTCASRKAPRCAGSRVHAVTHAHAADSAVPAARASFGTLQAATRSASPLERSMPQPVFASSATGTSARPGITTSFRKTVFRTIRQRARVSGRRSELSRYLAGLSVEASNREMTVPIRN